MPQTSAEVMKLAQKTRVLGRNATTDKKVEIQPGDCLLILAVGAVMVALILSILWGMGRIDGSVASWVITTCVGGAAISSVAGVVMRANIRNTERYTKPHNSTR